MERVSAFIAKFAPAMQRQIRTTRAALRKRLPTATELIYDNYNFFVMGFSPTERPSDAICSLFANAKGVNLCLVWGAKLPDPHKIMQGSGKQVRFVRLESAATLSKPEVEALIQAAIDRSREPFPATGKGRTIIRSIAAKQRPRR